MTLYKLPRRVELRLCNDTVIVAYSPPSRFGPLLIEEGPSRPDLPTTVRLQDYDYKPSRD